MGHELTKKKMFKNHSTAQKEKIQAQSLPAKRRLKFEKRVKNAKTGRFARHWFPMNHLSKEKSSDSETIAKSDEEYWRSKQEDPKLGQVFPDIENCQNDQCAKENKNLSVQSEDSGLNLVFNVNKNSVKLLQK